MNLPTFETYCANTTAANALRFDLGPVTVWYSYQTPVAFSRDGCTPTVRWNDWGRTTGKHLNAIDGGDKGARVTGAHFEALLAEVLSANPAGY
jgi:hypothetical protein